MNPARYQSSWAVVAALSITTILFGMAPKMKAADAELTTKQAKTLAARAKTPEDHIRLANYFNREAARLETDAKDHEELAQIYRLYPSASGSGRSGKGGGNPQSSTFDHCNAIVKSLREAAQSARELAADQEQMAGKDAK